MRTILIMLSVLLSYSTQAQVIPPKKASKIVVTLDSNAFNTSYKFLIEKGYTIDKADRDLGLIKTVKRDMHTINVNILDSTVYYSVTFVTLVGLTLEPMTIEACWCGILGDYRKKYFKKLIALFEGKEYTFK